MYVRLVIMDTYSDNSSYICFNRFSSRILSCITYLLTYFLTHLLTFLLTYLLPYLLTYLLTYSLTHLLTYLLLRCPSGTNDGIKKRISKIEICPGIQALQRYAGEESSRWGGGQGKATTHMMKSRSLGSRSSQ